jgi:hypothetical protein
MFSEPSMLKSDARNSTAPTANLPTMRTTPIKRAQMRNNRAIGMARISGGTRPGRDKNSTVTSCIVPECGAGPQQGYGD